jgi:predicted HicB family RNase H-like nuclease
LDDGRGAESSGQQQEELRFWFCLPAKMERRPANARRLSLRYVEIDAQPTLLVAPLMTRCHDATPTYPTASLRDVYSSSIRSRRQRCKEFLKTFARGLQYMAKEMKTAQVNLRIHPSLKAAAEKAAEAGHRSLTSLVEKLLADYCKRKGLLK